MGDLRALCAPLATLHDEAELLFFEEIKSEPVMVEALSTDLTLKGAELGHGDIIVVQRALAPCDSFRHPFAPSFLLHLKSRLVVAFQEAAAPLPRIKSLVLELTVSTTIGEARSRLASELGVQTAQHLRLLRPQDGPTALRPLGDEEVVHSLLPQHDGTISNTLMYEVLDAPGTHKSLSVDWLGAPSSPQVQLTLTLTCGQSVHDLLVLLANQLCATGQVPHGAEQQLRLLQLSCHRVSVVVPCDEIVDNLDDVAWRFRAEPIPVDQLHVAQDERIVHVAHVRNHPGLPVPVVPFGDPFLLKLREDEPLWSVKARVAALLGLDAAGAEFSSWRWGVVSSERFEPIPSDSHVVLPRLLPRHSQSTHCDTYLAVEHELAPSTKRSRLLRDNAVRSVHNRQMRIYN